MLVKGLLSLTLLSTLTTIYTAAVTVTCPTDGFAKLEDLVQCFEKYTVPEDYYTCATYDTAQPRAVPNELKAWTDAITHLLDHDPGSPCTLPPNSPISASYGVFRFTDSATGQRFCVLHEKNAVASAIHGIRYEKGWGLFITPDQSSSAVRRLHFSAPHPVFDKGTAVQAAAIFKRTVSKSLLIEGRHKHALSRPSNCFASCQGAEYHRTDGAHDNREPFHSALIAIHSWQATHGGCPLSRCSYLQWHGKDGATCPADRVFLSNGFVERCCYSNPTLPVNRIKEQLNLKFVPDPPWHHVTPPDDPICTALTGTDNLFGRYINGVRPVSAACTTRATPCSPPAIPRCGGADFGQFVHIEQDIVSRDPANYDKWAAVILGAFPFIPLRITAPEQQVLM